MHLKPAMATSSKVSLCKTRQLTASPVSSKKPDADTARALLKAGGHYWNSGMFLFSCRQYLDELEQYAPAMWRACKESWARSVP